MSLTPSITETNIITALRAFVLSIVDCEVIRAPVNRAAMPLGDFVVLSPLTNIPLSTNVSTLTGSTRSIMRPSQIGIQVDCYGGTAGDRATAISTLLRDQYAVDSFAASGFDMAPLYAGDSHQMPIVDGEQQYEERWTFEATLQFNPIMTPPQDSATALNVNLVNVDRAYPPH